MKIVRKSSKKKLNYKKLYKISNKIYKTRNIVHESVPISKDEKDNKIEKKWGEIPLKNPILHHHQLLYMIDGFDQKRGQKVFGHRGYFLKNYGLILLQSLINYGQNLLMKRNYTPIQTPFLMKSHIMHEICQLQEFEENLYKIQQEDQEDMYLIATSEQPLCGLHSQEWIDQKNLPFKYAGISSCFRKEAGAAGRQTWGIFRVHQFEKVEQFIICEPQKSWEEFDNMIQISEEFLQNLKIPYRVVSIVSGALNGAAAKKCDLECWFPGYREYKELMSISNCTDYQSRQLNIQTGEPKNKQYVHLLNGTLCAAQRTLTCILENYQEKEGIRVPDVLQPYVGIDFIKFKHEQPKNNQFD
ncbi:seryl-tRNA synthetase, putative [Ichthyophthirius multifiliis]|uniref:serine--tRNA ligase n=1 Tax=Ichthyophthirius multifiliis TaxID=5932 RepID=G0QJU8_ICHMU|nr:seryl-tRNA synthetase, putative [Ichthyophthirius multifiliis]EGR34499.1 seryl-tRNA synthetase, putative [Ichthyophthirius multifiliis]|eukprot:XP_004039803.1 seryl-tRNA synthetase, putative [Ichthyophthirius multifiliis]